jgi:glycosyltransferase involved in cell wall biosynthesis
MPTLMDTYGYSIIEGFSVGTPAFTTNVCALPEIVQHGKNGYVLELPLNKIRHWSNWLHGEKTSTEEYWGILNTTYNDLVEMSLQEINQFLDRTDKKEHYEILSAGALNHVQNLNNAEKQNQLFDHLYTTAAGLY